MIVKTEITISGALALKQSEINAVTREAMRALGLRWRRKYLPKHFTHQGAREYKYTRRKNYVTSKRKRESYVQRKKREKGHTLPLVWSGEGRREALRSKKVVATATSTKAKATIPLPSVFNFRSKFSKVDMRKEITTVSAAELRELEVFLANEMAKGLNEAGAGASVTVSLSS